MFLYPEQYKLILTSLRNGINIDLIFHFDLVDHDTNILKYNSDKVFKILI